VGGGTGVYALWLAALGHEVHLLDAAPGHIAQARENDKTAAAQLASLWVGDARALPFDGDSFYLVIMLGPLHHLTEAADRVIALAEARRALRPGGAVAAAVIARCLPP